MLTKSADALLGTALLRGMEVRLNYSTNEVVVEKKVEVRMREGNDKSKGNNENPE